MTNPMREIKLDKAVVNIGVGGAGERLLKAEKVLQMITDRKPVRTLARTTNRDFAFGRLAFAMLLMETGGSSVSGFYM